MTAGDPLLESASVGKCRKHRPGMPPAFFSSPSRNAAIRDASQQCIFYFSLIRILPVTGRSLTMLACLSMQFFSSFNRLVNTSLCFTDRISRITSSACLSIGKNDVLNLFKWQKIPESLIWRALQPETLCYRAHRFIRPQCLSTVPTRMWLGA